MIECHESSFIRCSSVILIFKSFDLCFNRLVTCSSDNVKESCDSFLFDRINLSWLLICMILIFFFVGMVFVVNLNFIVKMNITTDSLFGC
ncbi:hypothetical protein Hdeb2414_s0011g00368151 [Helianthus debilis subsp. tardiflorus]